MLLHEQFEELCALAIAGEIGEDEFKELREHLQSCAECRSSAAKYHALKLVFADAAAFQGEIQAPDGMSSRVIAGVRAAGIPLGTRVAEEPEYRERAHWLSLARFRSLTLAGAAGVCLLVIVFFIGVRQGWRKSEATLRQKLPATESTASTSLNVPLSAADQGLRDELLTANRQVATLSAQVKQQEIALNSLAHEKDQLSHRLGEITAKGATQQEEREQRVAEITELHAQLDKVQSEERDERTALLTAQAALASERLKAGDLESELSAAKNLNAALEQARDLITARNLHVKDIPPEVDANGKRRGPFGRVFYAEGRRLDFYAYDLGGSQTMSSRTSFYVWRESPGQNAQITKLGRLQIDNQKDGRWVLRVTDRGLLSNLNSVFVTREPDSMAVTRPSGQRMLFAFVGNQANHP